MKKVAIHSAPRSGSSWLGNIFNSHPDVDFSFQPLFSYAFKNYLNENSSGEEISKFFSLLKSSQDEFIKQKLGANKAIVSQFRKNDLVTHIVYKEVRHHHILENMMNLDQDVLVIGLVRNPFSTINSWLKAPKEFKAEKGWKIEEEWRFAEKKNKGRIEEFNGYEKWKEVVNLFLKLKEFYPDRFYLIKYEDLLNDTISKVKHIFQFCDLEMTEQTTNFLADSSEKNDQDAYSILKNKSHDDDWKKELPKKIISEIKDDPEFHSLNSVFQWI